MSVDSKPSLKAFASSLGGLPYPLLSDFHPKGHVSELYSIWDESRGIAKRACFLINKEGKLCWSKVYDSGLPEREEILQEITKLSA